MVHIKLLPVNIIITANIYSQQLENLNTALKDKRTSLVNSNLFYHDSAWFYIAKITFEKTDNLSHYSSDFDYLSFQKIIQIISSLMKKKKKKKKRKEWKLPFTFLFSKLKFLLQKCYHEPCGSIWRRLLYKIYRKIEK